MRSFVAFALLAAGAAAAQGSTVTVTLAPMTLVLPNGLDTETTSIIPGTTVTGVNIATVPGQTVVVGPDGATIAVGGSAAGATGSPGTAGAAGTPGTAGAGSPGTTGAATTAGAGNTASPKAGTTTTASKGAATGLGALTPAGLLIAGAGLAVAAL